MTCGADKLSNANISELLFVKIEEGGTQLAIGGPGIAEQQCRDW